MNKNNDAVAALSSSPVTMVAAAISDSTTTPANSSIVLNSAVVTTTLESNQHLYNSTGYLVEQDELEYSILAAFSDMQTVFLACIFTLLPLIIAVAIAFGVRHAWRKYRHKRNGMNDLPWYRGVSSREDTADSLHHCPNSVCIDIQPTTRVLSAHDAKPLMVNVTIIFIALWVMTITLLYSCIDKLGDSHLDILEWEATENMFV